MSDRKPINRYDLIVIGGGPGGYTCAIRSAQLGLKTVLIEKRPTLGGTCINIGCIPTKALLESSHLFQRAREEFADHGIKSGKVSIDIKRMMQRKEEAVKDLTGGLDFLMKKNKITVLQGAASFLDSSPDDIRVEVKGEKEIVIAAKRCVIAVGSVPAQIPTAIPDGKRIITSDEAIALSQTPEHLMIIGAGAIGLELGSIWGRLGAKITIIEMLPDLLPTLDARLRNLIKRSLKKQGMEFLFAHKVLQAKTDAKGVSVEVEDANGTKKNLEGDVLLSAAGRIAFLGDLHPEKIGVRLNQRGRIEVNAQTLETSVPGVYAIGDVIEGPMLAHKAEEDGIAAAEIIAGKPTAVHYDKIPAVVYTHPEIAWVGRSEESLKKDGCETRVGEFFFKANGRARAMGETDGIVRIITDKKRDRVLGVFIFGAGASELIAEATLAMEFGAGAEDIARTCHAHPTLAEAVKEAALAVEGRAIHS